LEAKATFSAGLLEILRIYSRQKSLNRPDASAVQIAVDVIDRWPS
jgi:hypothetical protein